MNEKMLIQDVLAFSGLKELPDEMNDKKKGVWIEGIAKIRLANDSIGYGILERTADLSYRIMYSNGDTSPVVKIESIYPTKMLPSEYIKKFGKDSTERDRIDYLTSLNLPYLDGKNIDEMSMKELNIEVVKAAVFQYLKS